MGVTSLLFGVLVITPRLILRTKDTAKRNVVTNLQLAMIFVLMLSALGTLGLYRLYKIGFEYDKFVHLVFTFVATAVLADFIRIWYGAARSKSVIISVVLVLTASIFWEFFEYFLNKFLDIQIFKVYRGIWRRDTILDLVYDTLGVVVAVFIKGRRIISS